MTDQSWPMCGAPTGRGCSSCVNAGLTCHHSRGYDRVRAGIRAEIELAERGEFDEDD